MITTYKNIQHPQQVKEIITDARNSSHKNTGVCGVGFLKQSVCHFTFRSQHLSKKQTANKVDCPSLKKQKQYKHNKGLNVSLVTTALVWVHTLSADFQDWVQVLKVGLFLYLNVNWIGLLTVSFIILVQPKWLAGMAIWSFTYLCRLVPGYSRTVSFHFSFFLKCHSTAFRFQTDVYLYTKSFSYQQQNHYIFHTVDLSVCLE